MSAMLMNCPAVTATPPSVSVPEAEVGIVVISTAAKLLAGLSLGSVKPKLAAAKVKAVSSLVVTVLLVPAGASFTEVTLMVMVFGDWSRLTPPLAVSPSSCTWKVKLASTAPLALLAGVNFRSPALMSAMLMNCPAVTATPPSVSVAEAEVGIVVISTAAKLLAGLSLGSVKPKLAAAKAKAVSSLVVTVLLVPAGASFTEVTLMVMVFGDWSRLTPPLAVSPSSCTWKVKLASTAPLALLAGVNFRSPALMSAMLMNCPAVTATPPSVSVAEAEVGIVVISTAAKLLAGLSLGSVKPKLAAAKAKAVSSLVVTVLLVPAGASFTEVTLMVMVFGDWSRLTPPLAVSPSSCTWKVKLASTAPLALLAGVKFRSPALMSAMLMNCPAVTATPPSVSVPEAEVGIVGISTAAKLLAGLSLGSVKPKLAAAKVKAVSSLVVTVLLVPAGASFTEVTLMVMVFGDWSRLTPPLAVSPSSCTWKVKLASTAPLALLAGVKFRSPALMSAMLMNCPAVTATPPSVSVPEAEVGIVGISTAAKLLAGLSLGSVKPKLAAAKVKAVSSLVVTVLLVPAGASFTEVTLMVMVFGDWSRLTPPLAVSPSSCTWKVKLASTAPLALLAGVKFRSPALMSAMLMNCPAVTATPPSVSVPEAEVGIVGISTAAKLLAGLSLGSVKPKLAAAKVKAVSSLVVTVLLVPAGASFTEVTLMVMVFGDWSRLTPPLAVSPSSCTWKVKLASTAPLALLAGVKFRSPALMSAMLMNCPAVTATPPSVSVPEAEVGIVGISTAAKLLAGLSLGSVKPKLAAAKVKAVSSLVVTVLLVPAGASFTEVTLMVMVFGDWSRLTPPLAVSPSSCTWKVKLASTAPLALLAGVNFRSPALMSAMLMNCPAVTATPPSVSVAEAEVGIVVISTAAKLLAGLSLGSVKPKLAAAKAKAVSSLVVTVLLVPAGASFTEVTLMVMVFGDWSRLTPPLAVPPSSCTWKVKLASTAPLALLAGVNFRSPALMSAMLMNCPAVTATPPSVSVAEAEVGIVVISTAAKLLAGLSLGSVKPKLAAAKAKAVSSLVVTVLLVPAGASFTEVTLMVMVFGDWSRLTPPLAVSPSSCTWKVKLASTAPLALLAGVNFRSPALMSAMLMNCPAVTATPPSVSVPEAEVGIVVISTAAKLLAGLSLGSVKPKLAAAKVKAVSSLVVTVLLVPAGASFTEVTLMVMVFGDWSRLTPPLAVPPPSCTWKVKLASTAPLALLAGVNFRSPALMSAMLMNCPAVTATPPSVSVPEGEGG